MVQRLAVLQGGWHNKKTKADLIGGMNLGVKDSQAAYKLHLDMSTSADR
jgi:hypothetical protein